MKRRLELVRIRCEEDFRLFAQMAFNEQVMKMDMGRIFTQTEAEGYFAYMLSYNQEHPNSGNYLAYRREDQVFIGLAALWEREEGAELEYMVLPEYWNRGYATEMVAQLLEQAQRIPDLTVVRGIMDPENTASQRVLKHHGFTLETTMHVEEDDSTVAVYRRTCS